MFARVFGLCAALVAAVALMSASTAASAKQHGSVMIDVSTRSAVVDYLRSIHIDPKGVVIQRGTRNYAGAGCPGPGWKCTTTTHPVVQVAAAGGRNTFLCSTASCAVVQVAAGMATATNVAKCIQTDGPETCKISQSSSNANNKAVVYQRAYNATGLVQYVPTSKVLITETASSKVSITQKATGAANSNEACVYQAITLARAGTFHKHTLILTQTAHQKVTIKQDSKNGGNSAAESATAQGQCTGGSITQRQTLSSNLTVPASITQNQNAADKGANVTVDIEQNQSTGYLGIAHGANSANFDQYNSLTAVANSPDGPVSQAQSSLNGGLLGTLNQDSREPSTASATQTEIQCQDAATSGPTTCGDVTTAPDSLTQTQIGPVRKGLGTATQTGNAADTFLVSQSSTQDNTTGEGQTNDIQGDCSTAGNCTVNQSTDINGVPHSSTKSGQNVNSTTNCTGNDCASTNTELFKEQFETGAAGWATTGKWHIQDQPQSVSVVSGINPELVTLPDAGFLPAAFGGTHNAWFGDPSTGTYCGTDWNSITQDPGCTSTVAPAGDLTSPSFDLSNATSAIVTFESWYEIEALAPSVSDQLSVLYSTDGGSTWTPAALLNPADDPGGTEDQSYSNNGFEKSPTWRKYTVDISAAHGFANVMVRFDFDAVDEFENGFRGWALDDVAVRTG